MRLTDGIAPHSLDPLDWEALRQQGHQMLDDMVDYLAGLRARPVWQSAPADVRANFRSPLPAAGRPLDEVYADFRRDIEPYVIGNVHPGFMGWVQGGGTAVGMLAELLAAGVNANVGGRDQIPLEVERQVTAWMRDLVGFPATANGVFVTGTSIANYCAVLVARTAALGGEVRQVGLGGRRLVAYASAGAHACVARALDFCGLGSDALRLVPLDAGWRMDVVALEAAIAADRAAGLTPFLVVGTAGSVDVGAVDPLGAIADVAHRERLWFHVDGAYGALGLLAPEVAPRLEGIERADSLAFDFHKWGQVPYDAGFLLVADGQRQLDTFANVATYLRREQRGMAANSPWPCDLGPDLSRGFRALKTWFTFQTYGAEAIGRVISGTCALARQLAEVIEREPELELLAPVMLNVVCFRYRGAAPDELNAAIAVALQESGVVAPSTTRLPAGLAIRAAIVNHRTTTADVEALVEATLAHGRSMTAKERP